MIDDMSADRKNEIHAYFRASKPWSALPESVSEILAQRLGEQSEATFQQMLRETAANEIVTKHFLPIASDNQNADLSIMLFAETLYNYGSMYTKELMKGRTGEANLARIVAHAEALFACARAIQPRFVSATFGLALLYGCRNDYSRAIAFCHQALLEIQQISEAPDQGLSVFERTAKSSGLEPVRRQILDHMDRLRSL